MVRAERAMWGSGRAGQPAVAGLLVVLIAASLLAGAMDGSVVPDPAPAARYGERYTLPAHFLIGNTSIAQNAGLNQTLDEDLEPADNVSARATVNVHLDQSVPLAQAPGSAPGNPAPMTEAMTPVSSALVLDDWVYAVVVKERAMNSVPVGTYGVTLWVGGQAAGTIYIAKQAPLTLDGAQLTPVAPQGVQASFDLGRTEPAAPLLEVEVDPLDAPAPAPLPLGEVARRAADTMYAERFLIPSSFAVNATTIAQNARSAPASTSRDQPANLSELVPSASTALVAGDWSYQARVMERSTDSVQQGNYSVTLWYDGQAEGTVYVAKAPPTGVRTPNATVPVPFLGNVTVQSTTITVPQVLPQGIAATFDLGPELPAGAPVFVVQVQALDILSYTLTVQDDASHNPFWQGVGGEIGGVKNPRLAASNATPVRVTITDGDNGRHNLTICGPFPNGTLANETCGDSGYPPFTATPDITSGAPQQSLLWVPASRGTYRYECGYHAGVGQAGIFQIT